MIRLPLAFLLFVLYGWFFRGFPLPTDAAVHTWFWLLLSGIVGFFLGDLCLFRALVLIGPRLSSLLMSLAPLLTALIAIVFLDERLSLLNWTGMLVTVLGVGWVVLERKPASDARNDIRHLPSATGVVLGILAALGQAAGSVFGKLGMGDYDPFAATQIRVMGGLAGFGSLFFLLKWHGHVYRALRNSRALALISLGSFTGPFLGVALLFVAFQYISAGVAQTFASIVPVTILPFLIVLYKEKVTPRALLGACIAVAGVALLFVKS
jgi:drug/metabolite transporter (DMT)-like permease